ncbi:hypothetical protein BCR32DRAFT_272401 [Anaeromyces robustus]|uniref:PH domain-containing protein n=1 Tax=Anaeromyces robustus TaxID=1754192 RepID=A0A1Y1WAN1_9FUNG|nr:hypothetical protein BCR32DRAFT_272401 [Anaeromyces robustus]|eukprot:ORX70378.1 hypothetical protein BCR32DRAFT_272401 [Anaeromyces robustus]
MPQTIKEFPHPEHINYWPYAEEQYSRTLVTFERFKSWKTVITGITEFFEKIESLDSCYSKQYSKLASVLEPSDNEYCGSFKNLAPIYSSAKKISISYSDSSKVIDDIIIQRLNDLKNGLIKKSKKYKQDFLNEFNKISKVRSESLISINNHQSLTLAKSKSTSLEITDPWLSERALINQLEKMVKDENDFQGVMNKLFEDMEEFDQHVVNQLQNVFDEYNSNKNKECNDVKLSLQNVSNVVQTITPNKPFSYFTKKYSITSSDLWTTPRTLENFTYKLSNIKILKEGVIYRRGNYISSNWKPSWLVLTDTGYLHCFNLKNISKSVIRQYNVHKKGNSENILKAGQDTYKNTDKDKLKTNFSVQLRSPRVIAVDSSTSKDNDKECCFSIIINNSAFNVVPSSETNEAGETTTNNNAKVKKAKSNKNQVVHQLRTDTEEIMQEWLNIINNKLKNIPLEVQPSITSSNINLTNEPCDETNAIDDENINYDNTIDNKNEASYSYSSEDIEQSYNTPLNGQIYPPFKSISTLIEEVNNVNESLKQEESITPITNPTIKSIKSTESIKYYLDNNKRSKEEPELSPKERAILAKNIITSDTNIGTDLDVKNIEKTINCYCDSSDMTLNQKINSDYNNFD